MIVQKMKGRIEIVISDTGPGLSDKEIEALFTPFFTTKKNGIGLGLVITREIIKQHKGQIYVKSNNPDQGASFIIHLPG